eukprot:gnl/TRDRNA2_/TRDRNA2_151234_c1_seq3.p2 gnl/TRDRNA2_/TRDRNA2_151234_c1~~gnl/TRDRNA2_/TRDRNA2_151234_c1_seq3.p2  ORF type:complete len:104 (+),score=14.99 gnl/TRDRNA2_/TRDRNA2_151234_c1_seq3:94-405(+)
MYWSHPASSADAAKAIGPQSFQSSCAINGSVVDFSSAGKIGPAIFKTGTTPQHGKKIFKNPGVLGLAGTSSSSFFLACSRAFSFMASMAAANFWLVSCRGCVR